MALLIITPTMIDSVCIVVYLYLIIKKINYTDDKDYLNTG